MWFLVRTQDHMCKGTMQRALKTILLQIHRQIYISQKYQWTLKCVICRWDWIGLLKRKSSEKFCSIQKFRLAENRPNSSFTPAKTFPRILISTWSLHLIEDACRHLKFWCRHDAAPWLIKNSGKLNIFIQYRDDSNPNAVRLELII